MDGYECAVNRFSYMNETIKITTKSGSVDVEAALFKHLFESSIISNHPDYLASIDEGKITFSSFINLCRAGHIAYSLFFGSSAIVSPIVDKESDKLFGSFGGQYGIGLRGRTLNLNVIRLLIKDVKMKQEAIARFIKTERHPHVKYLKNSKRSLPEQADYITNALGIDMDLYRSYKNKKDALMYLINAVEGNNIFVSMENTGTHMPQNFKRATGIAGVYIRHSKFPYVFIGKEGMADPESVPTRRAFTLMYLMVCLFKGQSKMVSLEQPLGQNDNLFELTELILMPAKLMPQLSSYTLDDLDSISNSLNVSASAALTRLDHLGYVKPAQRDSLRGALLQRYSVFLAQQKRKNEKQLKEFRHNPVNNIRIYQGKAYLRIIKDQYIAGKIRRREINRQLSYGGKGAVNIEKVFEGL